MSHFNPEKGADHPSPPAAGSVCSPVHSDLQSFLLPSSSQQHRAHQWRGCRGRSSSPWRTCLSPLEKCQRETKAENRDIIRTAVDQKLTLAGPTPTNISKNSEPLTEMNGTLASPAVAFASRVFPVPGGPESTAPWKRKEERNKGVRWFMMFYSGQAKIRFLLVACLSSLIWGFCDDLSLKHVYSPIKIMQERPWKLFMLWERTKKFLYF